MELATSTAVYVHGSTITKEKEYIMGLFSLFKPSKNTIIIDGLSLNESLGMKGKVPPRNQLQLLRRLSRFAQREKLNVVVVLSGSPLHKAPARKKFEEITVLYSKNNEAHAKYIVKTARAQGAGAILISDNGAVEKVAGGGVQLMRISTFRKTFDANGSESDNADRNSGARGGRSRQPRRRQQQKPGSEKAPEKASEKPQKESSDSDAINELIDLID
jgi:hypothetical protein